MERKKSTVEDYPIVQLLGKGTFGEVYLSRNPKGEFAVKKIAKEQLIKSRKLYQPYIEKEVLSRLNHPGIIRMYDTFSDGESIYLVLELCKYGELTRFFKSTGSVTVGGLMTEDTRRHYFAEMVTVLEHLKERHITHRDFKSSNLLVTADGHIKLTDFGCAYAPSEFLGAQAYDRIINIKKMSEQQNVEVEGERRATFVGTPLQDVPLCSYMSPEILKDSVCNFEADLWALGCIVYEVYVGSPPFVDADEYTVFKKIQEEPVTFPEAIELKPEVRSFISGLLEKDKNKRLGCGYADSDNSFKAALLKHPYFEGINFEGIFERPVPGFETLAAAMETQEKGSPGKKKEKHSLLSGIVCKKMFLGNYKERQMVLLSDPKLVYFDEESGEKKVQRQQTQGEIELELNTPVELEGNKFTVTGKKKKYFFKAKKEEHGHSASEWVEKIKEAMSKAFY